MVRDSDILYDGMYGYVYPCVFGAVFEVFPSGQCVKFVARVLGVKRI